MKQAPDILALEVSRAGWAKNRLCGKAFGFRPDQKEQSQALLGFEGRLENHGAKTQPNTAFHE